MLSGLEGGVFPWYSHDCRLKSPISCNQTWLAGKSLNWMGAAGKINELNGGLSSPSLMTPILHLEPQIPSLWTNTDVEFTHQFLDHLYFLDFSRFSWLFHVFFGLPQCKSQPNPPSAKPRIFRTQNAPGNPPVHRAPDAKAWRRQAFETEEYF